MKIQSITINKYKAFTKEETIPVGGSNVFIYGENGSGKSSFYYALKDFFQSSVEPVQMASLLSPVITATSKQDKTIPLPLHSFVHKPSAKADFWVISVDFRVA